MGPSLNCYFSMKGLTVRTFQQDLYIVTFMRLPNCTEKTRTRLRTYDSMERKISHNDNCYLSEGQVFHKTKKDGRQFGTRNMITFDISSIFGGHIKITTIIER